MKKYYLNIMIALTVAIMCFGVSSCSKDDDELSKFTSLFSKTDYFIDMLDKVYESYDILGKKSSDTSDNNYTVTPIGRLIVVKKKSIASDVSYNEIKDALTKHYKNNIKVKDVYLNNAGTVTIDCRK